jgi:hypothetical protein
MRYLSNSQGKLLLTFLLIAPLIWLHIASAQNERKVEGRRLSAFPENLYKRQARGNESGKNIGCPGRLLVTFPRPLSESDVSGIKSSLVGSSLPVSIAPLSPAKGASASVFLFESTDKKLLNEEFIHTLTNKFQHITFPKNLKNLSLPKTVNVFSTEQVKKVEYDEPEKNVPYIEPDYVISSDLPRSAADTNIFNTVPGPLPGAATNTVPEDKLWGLKKIGGFHDGALSAPGPKIQRNTIVAILDVGIESHDALNESLWMPQTSFKVLLGGKEVTCDKDSTHGVNFLATNKQQLCTPEDGKGHGNNIAGVIGAQKGDAQGVAPAAQLLPVKIMDDHGSGCVSDAIKAIDFLIYLNESMYHDSPTKIRIVNNSYGFDPGDNIILDDVRAIREVVKRANEANLLLVASAGDVGEDISENCTYSLKRCFPHYPASIDSPNLIAVAATGMTIS